MMPSKKHLKILAALVALAFLILPLPFWYISIKEFPFSIYFLVRLIGLYAFTFLSFYLTISLWGFVLNKIFKQEKLEYYKNLFGNLAILLIFIHPVVYFLSYFPSNPPVETLVPGFVSGEYQISFALASLAFYAILIYFVFRFILRHKRMTEIFVYAAFFFSFIHSYLLGSEIESIPIIYIWPIYLAIVSAGIIRKTLIIIKAL